MSPTSITVLLGSLSLTGFLVTAAIPQQPNEAFSLKDLAGVSSATLMFGALIYVLRFVTSERKAQAEERQKMLEANDKIAERFSATQTMLAGQWRSDSEAARKELHEVIRAQRTG